MPPQAQAQMQLPSRPAPPPTAPSKNKQSRDTIEGCRLLAKDDLARALGCDTDHGRLKFEHSAATWTERGDMLENLAGGRLRKGSARSRG